MFNRSKILICAISVVFLASCQTSMLRSFEKVHSGMDKHQVLETVGTPQTVTRLNGKDRWIYRFYDDGIRYDREVHFLDGMTVYIGEPWAPAPEKSAKQKDNVHAELEKAIEVKEQKQKEERKRSLQDFENEIKQSDKVQYLPQFNEIK